MIGSNIPDKCVPELKKYQAEFLQDRKEELAKIVLFLKDHEYLKVRKMIHKWEGICEPYGFQRLAILGKELSKELVLENQMDSAKAKKIIQKMRDYLLNFNDD